MHTLQALFEDLADMAPPPPPPTPPQQQEEEEVVPLKHAAWKDVADHTLCQPDGSTAEKVHNALKEYDSTSKYFVLIG